MCPAAVAQAGGVVWAGCGASPAHPPDQVYAAPQGPVGIHR